MHNKHTHVSKRIRYAILAAVGLSLSFASMGIWIRMMDESFDTFQQNYIRILVGGLLALLVFRRHLSRKLFSSLSKKEWSVYSLRAIVSYVLGTAAFTVAVQNAELGVVSFIISVPTLGVLAFLFFREKLPLLSIPFIALATFGIFLLTGADLQKLHFGIGEIAATIAMFGFNIGYLMARLHKKQRNNYENTTIILLLAWIPMLIISLVLGENLVPQTITLAALVGLAVSSVLNVVGTLAINFVFTNMRAYVAGNILLLEGIWAVLFGLMLYGEPITFGIIVGGLLIVASAAAVNKIDNRNEEVVSTTTPS